MPKLKVGQAAPQFSGINQDQKTISLADFNGKKLVLFFYPLDNTPTCTEEACNLKDNYREFKKQGYEVLGVSPDSPRKHQNFIQKFKLPYDLLSDKELTTIKQYGVWGKKTTFGRTYMGVKRTTFIINESGLIEKIIDKVTAKNHTEQIL